MFSYQSFRASSRISFSERKEEDYDQDIQPATDDIGSIVRNEEWYEQPLMVLVVGASGDLAAKKTYPSLFELWKSQLLPRSTTICGFARTRHTHEQLRAHLRPYLLKHTTTTKTVGSNQTKPSVKDQNDVDTFLKLCFYNNGKSYGDDKVLLDILSSSSDLYNLLVYLAIPPHVFGESTRAVKLALQRLDTQIPGFTRVILEKPFGRDTASCQELLDALNSQNWQESALYRIDHYLGKEIVQNIVTLRQHNQWLDALWNKNVVEAVHIVFKEPFGTEGRGGYFDPYGIIRDIIQNHLLQVLTLIAMDLPSQENSKGWTADQIRDEKVKVLKSMPMITETDCLLGQYDGYADDITIDNRETTTPTYACMRTWVKSDTWQGVPFILEAGKALDEHLCEARLYFRGNTPNALVFRLQPSPAVFFTANMKTPGFSEHPVSTHIGVDYSGGESLPEAYTKLVLEALRGLQTNFVRDDELLQAWKLLTPLLHGQESSGVRPTPYRQGSTGPEERCKFLEAMGLRTSSLPVPSSL